MYIMLLIEMKVDETRSRIWNDVLIWFAMLCGWKKMVPLLFLRKLWQMSIRPRAVLII